jgi:ABC-type nitrate/sulfonate/bicarbonate transport system substrate-binding protein/outer membrane protein OmpA-like peptidoglycan-associated protein
MQMQVTGKDVAHGFHLGIVPLDLSEQYLGDGRDDERMLAAGKLDCMVDTVDNVARHGSGPITIIIDESAGGDGIYARGVPSMYDLKGKRVAYVANDSSEFFIRYVLRIANISPKELTLLPYDTSAAAVEAFNRNEADAVSAYDPELVKATASGGVPLVTSDALRAIIDVILTSNVSIKAKPQLVQAFHHAWFATIKAQAEDYEAAAQAIAAWGNNDWTGVSKENAVRDFEGQLQRIAQANLKNNTNTMQFPAPIINHLELSRKIWSDVSEVSQIAPEALVEPRFVISAAQSLALQTSVKLINNTYSLSAATQPTALARANASASASTNPTATVPVTDIVQVDQAVVTTMDTVTATSVISTTVTAVPTPPTTINAGETLSVLPCKRFTFLPNSVELTAESRQTLDLCVLPLLQQRATMLLRVRGSAGWPGPAKSTEYEERVRRTAAQRAQAVVNYLISRGIDSARFLIETALPPPERRGINDARTAQDRFVEMSIVSGN